MRIIISPAKTMNPDNDIFSYRNKPKYLDEAQFLIDELRKLTLDEAIKLWKVSYKLGLEAYDKIKSFNKDKNISPAIFTYEGLQYKHISPKVLSEQALIYIEENLCVLSAIYGCIYAFEGISPYRLEMQAPMKMNFKGEQYNNLYKFWGNKIYDRLMEKNSDGIIINLASKEYSDCVTPYLKENDKMITCIFGEFDKNEKVKVKATNAKMARGYMVRFMAENNVSKPEELKKFTYLGFSFKEELSKEDEYVFIMDK